MSNTTEFSSNSECFQPFLFLLVTHGSSATNARGFFSHSHDFVVNNSTFNIQGGHDIIATGEARGIHLILPVN